MGASDGWQRAAAFPEHFLKSGAMPHRPPRRVERKGGISSGVDERLNARNSSPGFSRCLAQTNVEATFAHHVQYENGTLRICEDRYPLRAFSRVLAVAIGKAGHTIAAALAKNLSPQGGGVRCQSGRSRGAYRAIRLLPGWTSAAQRTIVLDRYRDPQALETLDANSLALYLLTSGGSACMENVRDLCVLLAY
jgi:glycerate-2-kinase